MSRYPSEGGERLFDILLVESKPTKMEPFIESFKMAKQTNSVYVVSDGVAALDFVYQRGDFEDVPQPDLILLDLDLPGKDGDEALAKMEQESELCRIPVIIFTSSVSAEDIARSYKLNVNAYLQCPESEDAFPVVAEEIVDFWLKLARFPPK